MNKNKKAFTLVELLIVVGIIGVLVSVLMPAMSTAQKRTSIMKTRNFLVAMSTALEQYQSEYGFFPEFLTQKDRINLDDGNNSEYMVKTLTGVNPDGMKLSVADKRAYNRKAARFIDFNNDNLVQPEGSTQWKLVDAFGNPNIYVCVDGDSNGFIKLGLPSVSDGLTSEEVREQVPNSSMGVRAKVLMFTLEKDSNKPGANFSSENVYSW